MSSSPPPPQVTMSGPSNLSAVSNSSESAVDASPARGAEYASSLRAKLFNHHNRIPALVHTWDFWYERFQTDPRPESSTPNEPSADTQDTTDTTASNPTSQNETYTPSMEILAPVDDVRQFWSVFNNFDIQRLPYRDRVHLFHRGVEPKWEDPRNAQGGSLCFKIPRSHAAAFWQELCLMAIGEQLQSAVHESGRETFRDDICGVSCSNRLQTFLVQVWNRDGEHDEGVERLIKVILDGLSPELRPKEGSGAWPYYRRHCEQKGFQGSVA